MSDCFVVMGVPRSGTSCIAGLLHRLGVDMGEGHFQPKDRFNPRGYYEDLRWRYVNQRLTGKGYNLPNIDSVGKQQKRLWSKLAAECSGPSERWGVKDPWFCYVGEWAIPIINEKADARLVIVRRQRSASVASVARHLRSTYKGKYKYGAERIIDHWTTAMERTLALLDFPSVSIRYEDVVSDPLGIVTELARFVYGETPEAREITEAVRFVTSDLKHF